MKEWFYAKGGAQEGPVDLATLQAKLQGGELSPTDLVWREGMAEWTAAEKVPEVAPPAAAPAAAPGAAAAPEVPAQPAAATSAAASGAAPMTPPAGSPAPPVSGLAIASLVCGILGLVSCYVHALFALPAVICGHMAMGRIKAAPGEVGGRGLALGGVIMGYIGLLLQILTIAALAIFALKVDSMQQEAEGEMQRQLQRQTEMEEEFQRQIQESPGQEP
ncbi:MAG: DUF4339 domain-containing protein [Akkermansiaceae bacterium]|nr:DUF4339 domain-containing protein [Akkermansiaceae bacterium]